MGFLDRAIKRGISNAVGSALENSVNKTISSRIGDAVGQNRMNTAKSSAFCTKCGSDMPTSASFCSKCGTRKTEQVKTAAVSVQQIVAENIDHKKYFSAILSESFSNYEVRTSVPVLSLGTGGSGKPYDFMMYQSGRPVAAIMLTEHNRDNNIAFRNAKKACVDANIPFINFYKHFANEKNYVIERIKSSLK